MDRSTKRALGIGGRSDGTRGPRARSILLSTDKYLDHKAAKSLIHDFEKGDDTQKREARKIIIEYLWGKPRQDVDIKSDGDKIENNPIIQVADKETAEAVSKLLGK